jgi:hypothetical protein
MSLKEIRDLASQKLNFEVKIDMPYKLCDFKPAYGFIFSDFIKDYDFWGFGDIDVIYGNIRDFISDSLLSSCDFICVRDDYVTGFFSLVRNTETANMLFTRSKDYVKVLSESKYCNFDECPIHIFTLLTNRVSIYDSRIKWDIESMSYIVKKYSDEKLIKTCFEFFVTEGMPGKLMWNNGILIYDNRVERLLYHLIDFKKYNRGYNVVYENIPDIYYIDADKIRYSLI